MYEKGPISRIVRTLPPSFKDKEHDRRYVLKDYVS